MTEEKISILLSDVSVEGNILEKDKMIVDAKVRGNIEANDLDTHSNSIIDGNIKCKKVSIGGKLKGNIKSDKINIKKTAEIEGSLNQKTLSIEEGAFLKIKTETYK
jgi:cytoskeletal protein CcmA (bactofilin family)